MKEEITCEINNQKIYGLTITPDNIEGKIPTVILCHGLTANYKRMMDCAELLKNYGIGSYIFDFRGGSDITISDGETEDMTVYSEVDDLNAVIDMVKTLDFVDTDKLYLLGHSQGGLVTALVANNRVEDIESIFLLSPAFNIPDCAEKVPLPEEGEVLNLVCGQASRKYFEDARAINLFEDVTGFNKSVYIFHGDLDDFVPLSYSEKACDAYDNAELNVLEDEGHTFNFRSENFIVKRVNEVINK